jgi:hypothetical protein
VLNQLEKFFQDDLPFMTLFLPEQIKDFEEIRVLTDDGNFLEIVARSKTYFYFMHYSH